MRLDIKTPKGQRTLAREQECMRIITEQYPNLIYTQTPKDEAALYDGMLVDRRDHEIKFIVEQKTRQIAEEQWQYYGQIWLITAQKLKDLQKVCAWSRIPLMGVLYMPPQGLILCAKLIDESGEMCVDYRDEETLTQENCNSKHKPKVLRLNRYVNMKNAKKITCKKIPYQE
jgi:hypothetical protein